MEIAKLVVQILISVSAAFLAAWLANRRFRNEKWWERKADAYTNLIEALHDMKWRSGEHFDAEIEQRQLSEEYSEQLWSEFKEARRNISRIAETSSFIVSPEVLDAVQDMDKALSKARNANTWFEHLDEQWGAVDECTKKIKEIGKKELNIKNT
ncbi:hypothetical protein [Vibrio ishigakensis]|uniref:hypothetical protein n=1 Tax=Vibrio ishigakensis TaxID=1481914 RepID=UPI0021C467C1|nr:hypothetical protein [Vibrio ishigakensis]